MKRKFFKSIVFAIGAFGFCANTTLAADKWVSLFNGESLDGWTVKFSGYEPGINYKDTFRAKDGVLSANYDQYDKFNQEWGHIFYTDQKFSNYIIRLEYRFVGEQVANAPQWAIRNNGIMLHCQSPQSMGLVHGWPQSIEAQLLGGLSDGKERPTGNLCTPGLHVIIDGELEKTHCINSSSKTYHGDQWVTAEVEVRGDKIIRHRINGELVMEYTKPQVDADDPEHPPRVFKTGMPVTEGYIALQAESHNTEFRNIMLLNLDEK